MVWFYHGTHGGKREESNGQYNRLGDRCNGVGRLKKTNKIHTLQKWRALGAPKRVLPNLRQIVTDSTLCNSIRFDSSKSQD